MYCENCGKEIPDGAAFCSFCGKPVKNSVKTVNEKNMVLALIISFILIGLGIVYAGNKKKGLIFFVAGFILNLLGRAVPVLAALGLIIWAYALYDTYNEVKIANGEPNPNLINDIKEFSTPKKIGSVLIILIIFLLLVGGIFGSFSSKNDSNTDIDDELVVNDTYYDTESTLSSSSSNSNSVSSSSSSSSSDGYDTHSHYEGEYGSSDTYGTVNDDGSVDAYQTGHTDYGDYKIDSHMDSDGNLHGTVEMGGKTYYVNN